MAMRGRFNIDRIENDEQALEEMNHQYNRMLNVESTSARKSRFYNMLDIYDRFPVVRELWQYVKDAAHYVKKFVKRCVNAVGEIIGNILNNHDYFYIMRFYKENGDFAFDKIGSSIDVERRFKQHIENYKEVDHGKILFKFDTEYVAASSLENVVRNFLVKTYGAKKYIPKDRFSCRIDVEAVAQRIPQSMEHLRLAEMV